MGLGTRLPCVNHGTNYQQNVSKDAMPDVYMMLVPPPTRFWDYRMFC